MYDFLKNFLFNPIVAFTIFVFFIVGYLVFLDMEGAFTETFLHFGPDNNTKFINMKVDTWEKVILIYVIGFVTSILTTYYQTTMTDFVRSKIWNPAFKEEINMSKSLAHLIVALDPILFFILKTLQFFLNVTMRLQFIIPQLLGNAFVNIPFAFLKVNENTFKK